jgi:hypothetical protein
LFSFLTHLPLLILFTMEAESLIVLLPHSPPLLLLLLPLEAEPLIPLYPQLPLFYYQKTYALICN